MTKIIRIVHCWLSFGLIAGVTVDSAASMQELMTNLLEFQKSGYLCDTLILVDDGQVKAHSAVLAAASPVFKHVLKNPDQPMQHTIVLPGIQLVVVNIIIQFVYTGKMFVPKDNYCKVMDAICDLRIKLNINRYLYFASRVCVNF